MESIIIDGVNVAECEHFTQEQPQLGVTCLFYAFKNKNKCEESPNCYYKQLQRKTQECENLRDEINEERKKLMWITQNNKVWYSEEEYNEMQEEYEALKQTYEACKKEYNALTKRYHELQGVLNANKKRI